METIALMVTVVALGVAGVSAGVPACDTSITGKMSSLYPKGIPNNILDTISNYGDMSYRYVSKDSAGVGGVTANCIKVSISGNVATVTYMLPLISIPSEFTVKEVDGVLIQVDGAKKNQLFVLYLVDGVLITYRCCGSCTGTGPDVGIAVAINMANQAATLASLKAAKALLKDLGLDGNLKEVKSCK